jgi:hypothetical protein
MLNESEIQEELQAIKERNQRVELDKAWEVSWTRRLFITAATYVIAGIWLVLINDTYPWLNAFVRNFCAGSAIPPVIFPSCAGR